jgi:NDP-sugar pyrophosphorylase family protein
MVEVGGRPIIEYGLRNAARTEADELIVVVGYRAEDVINAYGISYGGKRLRYAIQSEQHGMVHAIECAAEAIGGHDFILFLGDVLVVNPRYNEMIAAFREEGLFASCGVLHVTDLERIKKTFTVALGGAGQIVRLAEKPRKPFNSLMGTGEGVFRNEILRYLPLTPPSIRRNERELADLVQCAIDDGEVVRPYVVCDDYVNVNTEQDLLAAQSFQPKR